MKMVAKKELAIDNTDESTKRSIKELCIMLYM